MTLRTFSSILPFTRRFGVRGVTCMTNGALGGGGGGKDVEREKPSDDATMNQKAKWSMRHALLGKPKGLLIEQLRTKVRKDWSNDSGFEGPDGRQRIGAAKAALQRGHEIEPVPVVGHKEKGPTRWRLIAEKPSQQSVNGLGGAKKWKEEDLYPLVANGLVSEGECTEAIRLGEARNRVKWANPDVVGERIPPKHAKARNFPTEVVAAEVKGKAGRDDILGGFTQAVFYRERAHRAYLVLPKRDDSEHVDRIKQRCVDSGVGLAFLDFGVYPPPEKIDLGEDPPSFEISIPARSGMPDPVRLEELLTEMEKKKKEGKK